MGCGTSLKTPGLDGADAVKVHSRGNPMPAEKPSS